MPRLRTTTGLSALALAIGIAGTGWLSTLTSHWHGPASRFAAVVRHAHAVPHALPSRRRSHGPVYVVQAHRAPLQPIDADSGTAQAAVPLMPLATPDDGSQTWDSLRGHLDGQVRLHVDIDGGGRVRAARLTESSGDPVLDEHALRSVQGWRFAVPPGHPDGFGGELPMRFSSRDSLARVP
ncbi:energy transducer TonB family protein [Rhodanobacter sp. Col0626]|uniref:energy transducer TonB family protein n=1 Tax=Rhodanobacter sp. Col0626 TaxID=3415679 RepID=UPI003CF791CB